MFRDSLKAFVGEWCDLTAQQLGRLEAHYRLLVKWNRVINLTRIEEESEAVRRHYAESLFLAQQLGAASSVADLGSGAGFPGVPVAILNPDVKVTLIESHARKSVFLKEATRDLSNVRVLTRRFEDVSERFDCVISRAVSWEDLSESVGKLADRALLLATHTPDGPSGSWIELPWEKERGVLQVR